MTNFKHLTQIEFSAYHNDTLEKAERQKVKKHLLNCAECRKQLPLPSVEQFWVAIMTDSDNVAPVERELEISTDPIYAGFSSFLKLQSGLLWDGALFIIIFSFSFLLWMSVADSKREVAGTFNNGIESEQKFSLPANTPTSETKVASTNSNRVVINSNPKITKTEVPKQKSFQGNLRKDLIKPNLKQKEVISSTRGVADCNEEKNIGLEVGTNKENFVFKWKKVKSAVKYHLYISDDDEILIDEYETVAETTFTLKKSLDPLKSYKWKIIVTLENGKTIIGASQKFTTKNVQNHQVKSEKRKNSDVRCQTNQ